MHDLSRLPSVERLAQTPRALALIEAHGRPLVLDALREALAGAREAALQAGRAVPGEAALLDDAAARLAAGSRPSLRPVLNLTGTVLHTNLGRAPLPPEAVSSVAAVAAGASNLEFSLAAGRRGDRDDHVEAQLCRLTGAEAATVVNNNAAAVLLVLSTLARAREVVVSRGELIEIGGAFRMPEIMESAGCVLREVGTTNRTHGRDFERAIHEATGLVFKVHKSNYEISGFTTEVAERDLARIAHARGVPFAVDLGSGSLADLSAFGLPHEPTPAECLAAGADLVTFSGDKLLGGPQAGLIVGRADLVARLKSNPLKRALRCDKMTIAALSEVLRLYGDPARVARRLPALALLSRPRRRDRGGGGRAAAPASRGARRARPGRPDRVPEPDRQRRPAGRPPAERRARDLAARTRRCEAAAFRRPHPRRPACARHARDRPHREGPGDPRPALPDRAGRPCEPASGPPDDPLRHGGGPGVRSALVGVVGHVDHGKTSLVRALTGTETDRLAEEKARGLSIVLGFAVLRGEASEIDLIDMPGHERFVRAMISGATGIDAVLVAVDAGEGIKPQTVEHIEIASLVGVSRGVVALTKCDVAPARRVSEVAREVEALCRDAGLAIAATVETSAVSGRGIGELAAALEGLAEEPAEPPADAALYLPIDRSFSVRGFGTVVTGTLRGGALAVGSEVEVAPGGRRAEVRGLQIHGASVARALPGRRVAVNLRGVEVDDLPRGHALASPGRLGPSRWLDVSLAVPRGGDPLATGATLSLLVGTREMPARLRLLDSEAVAPGDRAVAQLKLGDEIAVPAGEPFVLRVPSPARTVAGGRVLDPVSRRRRRRDDGDMAPLRHLARGEFREAAVARLAAAGRAGLPVGDLARVLSRDEEATAAMLREWGLAVAGGRALHPDFWRENAEALARAVIAFARKHPLEDGLPRSALPSVLPGLPPAVAAAVADHLVERRILARRGGALRPNVEQAARDREARMLADVERAFAAAGLKPPDETEVVGGDPRRLEALRYLLRQGTLVRTTDRVQKRTITFHRAAIEGARRTLAEALGQSDGFAAKEAGAALGISRKFSIPLLEHFDAVRFTRRSGDRRVIVVEETGAGSVKDARE